jgi:hypothetical protein
MDFQFFPVIPILSKKKTPKKTFKETKNILSSV